MPVGKNTDAFLSRTLYLPITFDEFQIEEMLVECALNGDFEDKEISLQVAQFLAERLPTCESSRVNLRTLRMGYEVASNNPGDWKRLLVKLLPKSSPKEIVAGLSKSNLPVKDQAKEFSRLTGYSRRTFFNHKKAVVTFI